MMNSVVRIVVTALWVVVFALIPVDAVYSAGVILGRATTGSSSAVSSTPSSARFLEWLALRLTSPPASPRLVVV